MTKLLHRALFVATVTATVNGIQAMEQTSQQTEQTKKICALVKLHYQGGYNADDSPTDLQGYTTLCREQEARVNLADLAKDFDPSALPEAERKAHMNNFRAFDVECGLALEKPAQVTEQDFVAAALAELRAGMDLPQVDASTPVQPD